MLYACSVDTGEILIRLLSAAGETGFGMSLARPTSGTRNTDQAYTFCTYYPWSWISDDMFSEDFGIGRRSSIQYWCKEKGDVSNVCFINVNYA